MSIRAVFPLGWSEITIHGLHQWDYGQQLEIHAEDLPGVVEVHFACQGMKDARVRVCETVSGVASVAIPDQCLEQTSPITAWICEVNETAGTTIKTITLPIIARARPKPGEPIPEDFSDKYTEAISAFNAATKKLEDGSVKAAKAGHADTAGIAEEALHVGLADEAKNAINADAAKMLNIPYGYQTYQYNTLLKGGLTAFVITFDGYTSYIIADLCDDGYSPIFGHPSADGDAWLAYQLEFVQSASYPGMYTVKVVGAKGNGYIAYATIKYKKLSLDYAVG